MIERGIFPLSMILLQRLSILLNYSILVPTRPIMGGYWPIYFINGLGPRISSLKPSQGWAQEKEMGLNSGLRETSSIPAHSYLC